MLGNPKVYEVRPYGAQTIEVWGAVVNGQPRVAATIPDNFLISTVAMSSAEARAFAADIIEAAEAAERAAAAGITTGDIPNTGKAEAQRAAGLRTMPKPGEPGSRE